MSFPSPTPFSDPDARRRPTARPRPEGPCAADPRDPAKRTGAGDAARLEAEMLFRRHGAWLRRVLNARFGPEVAEDLVQETWLRLAGRDPERGVRRPRPFLFRIAVNLLVDRRRRAAVRPAGEPLEDLPRSPSTGPEQHESLILKQVVLSMPAPLREVFLLSRVGGLSYQSIAEHLNISAKTVEWRMSKALAYCARRLRD